MEKNKLWKTAYHTSMAVIILIISLIFLFFYWAFYPYKTFETKIEPLPVITKDVIAGENLVFKSSTCRYFVGEVDVHMALVDGILLGFPDYTFYQDKVECKEYDRVVNIPESVPAGTYKLEITSTVKVNPIRAISDKFITEEFNVIK